MRTQFFSTIAVAVLLSAPVFADEPIELSAQQMDQVTAGSLLLKNGKVIFGGFDNPAPNVPGYLGEAENLCGVLPDGLFCHPALNRRSDKAFVTAGKGPQVGGNGNDGPWSATVASPVISCPDCP